MRKIFIVLIAAIAYRGITMAQVPSIGSPPFPDDNEFSGIEDVLLFENDGGLYTAGAIPTYQCNTTISPSIQIVNTGSNFLTTAKIQYSIDLGSASYYDWSGFLEPGEVDTIQLPEMSVVAGSHMLTVSIIEANGMADINGGNNNGSVDFFIIGTSIPAPVSEGFDQGTLPEGYFIQNPDADATWNVYADYEAMPFDNYLLQMPFYHSYDAKHDNLYLKNFDLSNNTEAFLTFDLAYVYYSPAHFDELVVMVSADCGNDWNIIYDKFKDELATTSIEDGLPYSDIEFSPVNPSQWRNEFIDLSNYAGFDNVMIRFEGISGHGNNLYLDNIKVSMSVGIDEVDGQHVTFQIFPNPADEQVTIAFDQHIPENAFLTATNMLGQNIYSSSIDSSLPIYLATGEWPQGVYIFDLLSSNSILSSKKIIVSHR